MDMTTNKIKQELCKLLKLNVLPKIENAIKSHICNHCVSTRCCIFEEVSIVSE